MRRDGGGKGRHALAEASSMQRWARMGRQPRRGHGGAGEGIGAGRGCDRVRGRHDEVRRATSRRDEACGVAGSHGTKGEREGTERDGERDRRRDRRGARATGRNG